MLAATTAAGFKPRGRRGLNDVRHWPDTNVSSVRTATGTSETANRYPAKIALEKVCIVKHTGVPCPTAAVFILIIVPNLPLQPFLKNRSSLTSPLDVAKFNVTDGPPGGGFPHDETAHETARDCDDCLPALNRAGVTAAVQELVAAAEDEGCTGSERAVAQCYPNQLWRQYTTVRRYERSLQVTGRVLHEAPLQVLSRDCLSLPFQPMSGSILNLRLCLVCLVYVWTDTKHFSRHSCSYHLHVLFCVWFTAAGVRSGRAGGWVCRRRPRQPLRGALRGPGSAESVFLLSLFSSAESGFLLLFKPWLIPG